MAGSKRRDFNIFSLSFLDIMSCGLGAVILVYIIVNHATGAPTNDRRLLAEVKGYEQQLEATRENLKLLKKRASEQKVGINSTETNLAELLASIKKLETELALLMEQGISQEESIETLKSELKELELEAGNLEGSIEVSEKVALRNIVGEGDRQYLTGIRVGGERLLILLDASASMLDSTIVNIIRRRNLPDEEKLASEKWQRAIRTVEWITANMADNASFQLFTFNESAQPALTGTGTKWLNTANPEDLEQVLSAVRKIIPGGGTSLHHAFSAANQLKPGPDNIFLVVDGLPTLGFEVPRRSTIKNKDRIALFNRSLDLLPLNSSINIILFPMEGDPMATSSYWHLAQVTGGSFLAPSEDWP